MTFSAQVDIGGTFNPAGPHDDKNFGRLFDDKANQILLNQVLLTAQRPINTTINEYDIGFKLQGLYGSDARYTHFLNQFQHTAGNSTNQVDLTEANLQIHLPHLTKGGLDVKVGQYASLQGAEATDPSLNYLYSHSYIFNFGVPVKHTGILSTLHLTPAVDIYAGIDAGVNTAIGKSDNNDAPAFNGGIGLNFPDNNLTILALTHIGPESGKKSVANGLLPSSVDANRDLRALTTLTTTWKATDKLTLINDLNWIHDEVANSGHAANGYGIAQYGIYNLNKELSLVARGEIYRDDRGIFVFQSGNNVDAGRSLGGLPALSPRTVTGGETTYGELTLGLNIKPETNVSFLSSIMLRPEIRYDSALNGKRPFNDSTDKDMFTAAMDVVLTF